MYLVAYRAKAEDEWSVFKCHRSGEITFDAYRGCFEARRLCREGHVEAQVLQNGEVYARFSRTSTGGVVQEGGLHL